MALFTYDIKISCENCGKDCLLRVKKGITVMEFAKDKRAKCNNCGCVIEFKEYKTKWLE